MNDITQRLAYNNLALMEAQEEYTRARQKISELEKERKEIYKTVFDTIQASDGKLTLDKLLGGIE